MSKDQKNQKKSEKVEIELVKVIRPHKEEGWFCFTEYEIPLHLLEENSKIVSKSNPDLFAIFKDQVVWKIRDIFGL